MCSSDLAAGQQRVVDEAILWHSRHDHVGDSRVELPKKTAIPVAALGSWIRQNLLLDIHAAPWKKDDATLVPAAGPCTTCQKRSSANASLFDDLPKHDLCLDVACYESKRQAHLVAIQKKAESAGKPIVQIGRAHV